MGDDRRVDALNPGVDHLRRVLGEGEAGERPVDPQLIRRRINRRLGPAVEHGIFANGKRESEAKRLERSGVGHGRYLGAGASARKFGGPLSGRLTSTSATTIIAAPVQSSGVKLSP